MLGPAVRALEKSIIENTLKNPGFLLMVSRVLRNSGVQNDIKETISLFASTYKIRLNDSEAVAETVIQVVEKKYTVGDISNSTVTIGENIVVNNVIININMNGQHFNEIVKILSEIPDIRIQLESNMQDYEALKQFANNTLDPFLENFEKILTETTDYKKLKQALKLDTQ